MSGRYPDDAHVDHSIGAFQKAAAAAPLDELKNVRAIATSWLGTIATLTGLISVAGVTFGSTILDGLSNPGGVQQVLWAVFGLTLVATFLAAIASQGTPRVTWSNSGILRKNLFREAAFSAKCIGWSRVLTILAIILLAVAGRLVQVGAAKPSGFYQVQQHYGPMMCGYGYYKDGVFYLFKAGKEVTRLDADLVSVDVQTLTPVKNCTNRP